MRTQKLSVLDGWEKVITLNPRQTEIFSTEEMQSEYRPKGLLKSSAMATTTPTVGPPTAGDGIKVVGYGYRFSEMEKSCMRRFLRLPTKLLSREKRGTRLGRHLVGERH